ncbi:DNA internalization-related competence protein ComEC/Rec2 [Paraglaciecola marina]|uniref:DNA internalization-related competence protein ComEC/Rec2 n=1 Tax=Paraglaciecola marina TaxID=2500157 RepID=UPI00105C7B68|nr:DNA internalization-related competence protein ComEC/Rec2 [Paraglaciecola marina]
MDSKLFSFIAAAISSLIWTNLPSIFSIILLLGASFLFAKQFIHLAYFLIGIVWMASVGHWQYSLQLSSEQTSESIVVVGEITTLIHKRQEVRFTLKVTQINTNKLSFSRNIRVSWRQPSWLVQQGQIVKLEVKLKPPHGLANEAGFNYRQWLFSKGIIATGYVKETSDNELLQNVITSRQALLNKLLNLELDNISWISALTVGYRGLLQQKDWLLVQQSGIAHLIAISGLHLAMVASASYFIFSWAAAVIVSRIYRLHQLNLHIVAMTLTILTTFGYSSLAGFGLPTLRAWLMLSIAALLIANNKNIKIYRQLLIGISVFLILFPLSIYGLSFWLSYTAVVIICLVFWRWPITKAGFSITTAFSSMLRVQLCLTFLMLPIVAWQFSYVSIVSPLVNLIAVPLVTLCLLPLCLLATLLLWIYPDLAILLFRWVDYLIGLSLDALNNLVIFPWASIDLAAMPFVVWGLVFIALVLLLLPNFGVPKKCLVLLFLPFLSFLLQSRDTNWKLDILDVGQGTSVLITKNHKAIIYDVGASYPSGFNMADSVLLPILKSKGIKEVDIVIVSHGDNDHAGSLPFLLKGVVVTKLMTTADLCREGSQFNWQGLNIEVFWPDDPIKYDDNNSSCVVKISDQTHSVLLPGDIDKTIEYVLVEKYAENLKADILLAPHHGSNTSSSTAFIEAVNPRFVIFSQGFMNRWQFPRKEVIERYQTVFLQEQIPLQGIYATSETGQVSFSLPFDSLGPIQVKTYRQDIYPYWYAN